MKNLKQGFTLLEIMVVIAVVVILIAIVLPSFKTMRNNQILKTSASDIFSALDKAKSQSLSSIDSSEYGVHFDEDKIIIFKGTVFSELDPENEEILIYPPATISNINLTNGATEIYFDRLSGAPNKTGNITISIDSLLKVVTISPTGAVSMD